MKMQGCSAQLRVGLHLGNKAGLCMLYDSHYVPIIETVYKEHPLPLFITVLYMYLKEEEEITIMTSLHVSCMPVHGMSCII